MDNITMEGRMSQIVHLGLTSIFILCKENGKPLVVFKHFFSRCDKVKTKTLNKKSETPFPPFRSDTCMYKS